jgi:hypothetical protein
METDGCLVEVELELVSGTIDESSSSLMEEPLVGSFDRLTGAIEVEGTLSAFRIPDEEVRDVIELDEDAAFKAEKSLWPLRESEEAYPELVDDADGGAILSLKSDLKPEL